MILICIIGKHNLYIQFDILHNISTGLLFTFEQNNSVTLLHILLLTGNLQSVVYGIMTLFASSKENELLLFSTEQSHLGCFRMMYLFHTICPSCLLNLLWTESSSLKLLLAQTFLLHTTCEWLSNLIVEIVVLPAVDAGMYYTEPYIGTEFLLTWLCGVVFTAVKLSFLKLSWLKRGISFDLMCLS